MRSDSYSQSKSIKKLDFCVYDNDDALHFSIFIQAIELIQYS